MKNNWPTLIGIFLIMIGVTIGVLSNYQTSDLIAFASIMFGSGLACCNLWDKRDESKNKWFAITGVVAIGLGAFTLGFCGFAESTMTTIITTVAGLVAIIIGVILSTIKK